MKLARVLIALLVLAFAFAARTNSPRADGSLTTRSRMNFFRVVLVILLAIPLAACALSGEAVQGRVLEEGTNKPIPGAIVVVRWLGRTTSGSWLVEASTVCYHVETATTDEHGNYETKVWRQPQNKDYTVKFGRIGVDAYKPGYGRPGKQSQMQEIRYLAPLSGTREEMFKAIRTSGVNCDGAGQSQRNLIPLYRAIYVRLNDLAVTKEEKLYANAFLNGIEDIELPYEEATRRDLERRERIRNENK